MGGKPHGEGGAPEGDAAGLPPNAAPSGRIPVPRHLVRLPLEVATHLECKWRDGKFYPARIIERRKVDGSADEYEYYVHYRKCEWHCRPRLDPAHCFVQQRAAHAVVSLFSVGQVKAALQGSGHFTVCAC